MILCEIYARARGIYRQIPPPHHHDYPLRFWPPVLSEEHPIVALGDSMTEGVGARPDFSYPSQLAGITGLPVINAGHRGDTAGEAIDRLECDVFSHSPGLVLLCLGGNDLIRRIPPQTTMRDLETIIVQTHARQIPVCILGLRGSWLLKIDHDLPTRQLARDTGCPLLPLVLDGIWGIPWKMAEHVHPNRWGYREMAQRVARTLAEHGVSCAEISSKNNPPTAP